MTTDHTLAKSAYVLGHPSTDRLNAQHVIWTRALGLLHPVLRSRFEEGEIRGWDGI